jgi:hypothetical protein
MTVGEAIEQLKKYPPDTLFGRADNEWCEIRTATAISITAAALETQHCCQKYRNGTPLSITKKIIQMASWKL